MKKLTTDDKAKITSAAHETFQQIGYDLYSLCEEHGERLTEAGARESIVDANRTPIIDEYLDNGYTYKQIENVLKKTKFT